MEEIISWVEVHLFERQQMVHLLTRLIPPAALKAWMDDQGEGGFAEKAFTPSGEKCLISEEALEGRLRSLVEWEPPLLESLLRAWGALSPAPPVLRDIRALRSDRLLKKRPDILRRYPADIVIMALLCEERREALEWLRASNIAAHDPLATPKAFHTPNPSHIQRATKLINEAAHPVGSSWADEEHGFLLSLAMGKEFFDFLFRSTNAKALWAWIQGEEMEALRTALEQECAAAPSLPRLGRDSLHTPAARHRLLRHLLQLQERHPTISTHLLWAWKHQRPTPTVLQELRSYKDPTTTREALPRLRARFGGQALLAALYVELRSFDHITWMELLSAARAMEDAAALVETAPSSVDKERAGTSPSRFEITGSDGFEIELRPDSVNKAPLEKTASAVSPVKKEIQSWVEALTNKSGRQLAALEGRIKTLQEKSARDEAALSRLQAEVREMRAQGQQDARAQEQQERAMEEAGRQTREMRAAWEEETVRRERAERRARAVEAELEDERQRAKRTRRQMQATSTSWRRLALSALEEPEPAPLADSPSTEPISSPIFPAKDPDPWQVLGEWEHAGRRFRLAPRELQRQLRRGDENAVFALSQAWQEHGQIWPAQHAAWQEQLRALDPLWGPYLRRVLEEEDAFTALVDASNVARFRPDERGRGRLQDLVTMLDELRCQGAFPLQAIADASLPHVIDDRAGLFALVERGEVELTPSGTEADEWLTRRARERGAFVVTNDRHFHKKVAPSYEPLRVGFFFDTEGKLNLDEF